MGVLIVGCNEDDLPVIYHIDYNLDVIKDKFDTPSCNDFVCIGTRVKWVEPKLE